MRVAFATQDFEQVDAHFGWAQNIAIYEVSAGAHRLVEVVGFGKELKEDGNEDKLGPKLDAIKNCAILYVTSIGGSAAARVIAQNVLPVKLREPETIESLIRKLRVVLNGTPPPWLRKAVLRDQPRDLAFYEECG